MSDLDKHKVDSLQIHVFDDCAKMQETNGIISWYDNITKHNIIIYIYSI